MESEVELTCIAYVRATPARPPVMLFLSATTNKAAKNTMKAPRLSNQKPNHLGKITFFLYKPFQRNLHCRRYDKNLCYRKAPIGTTSILEFIIGYSHCTVTGPGLVQGTGLGAMST